MISIRKILILSLTVFNIICHEDTQKPHVVLNDYKSASVLPTFTHRNIKYGILSREAYGITKKYKYDDFSGGRDKGETDPFHSAAREFEEEGILADTLGWNLDDTKRFMNQHTTNVIVYSKDRDINNIESRKIRNVTYIVNFNEHKTRFFDNFYDAYNKQKERYNQLGIPKKHRHLTEKDRIAKVKWDDLKCAIANQENIHDTVYVQALVIDPITRQFYKKMIKLRPFLVIKLRPFFCQHHYEEGEDERVRYYKD